MVTQFIQSATMLYSSASFLVTYCSMILNISALKAQWLSHRLMGSCIKIDSSAERVFKGPVGRCTTTTPCSFSLTSNRVTTNY